MDSQLTGLPDENSRRFVAVLNEKVEIGRLLNALGHMTAGLSAQLDDPQQICLLNYKDADGGNHPNISHFPFIVLKAENSNQIRKARQEAIARGVCFTDFTETMTIGTSAAQLEATGACPEEELKYFGLCMFGETSVLRDFTSRFSLFR